jgi:hypothetical protein
MNNLEKCFVAGVKKPVEERVYKVKTGEYFRKKM